MKELSLKLANIFWNPNYHIVFDALQFYQKHSFQTSGPWRKQLLIKKVAVFTSSFLKFNYRSDPGNVCLSLLFSLSQSVSTVADFLQILLQEQALLLGKPHPNLTPSSREPEIPRHALLAFNRTCFSKTSSPRQNFHTSCKMLLKSTP